MPLAFWCVLIAALMPYLLVAYAKAGARDNNRPRDAAESLQGAQRRAYAAHQNSFETFPFFAAAVITAQLLGAGGTTLNVLAGIYILIRVAYAYFYIADIATTRSLVWGAGLFVNIAIFVLPVFK